MKTQKSRVDASGTRDNGDLATRCVPGMAGVGERASVVVNHLNALIRHRPASLARRLIVIMVMLLGHAATVGIASGQPTLEVVASFRVESSSGRFPSGGLVQGSDGSFYGMTIGGGSSNAGTIFRLNASGTLTTLHSFTGADGSSPSGALIQGSDANFYGTTSQGGTGGFGTVFRLDTAGTLTTLHNFTGADGAAPRSGLIEATDGNFYGTTSSGGSLRNEGSVFKLDAAGTLTTLHSFTGLDGSMPIAALIQGKDGNFYGTTYWGGVSGVGTVFKLDTAGTLTTLYSFTGSDYGPPSKILPEHGKHPEGLMQARDGSFYGTTSDNLGPGLGTVFKLDLGGTLTTLHRFTGSDGVYPRARLLQANDGNFYGTTIAGNGTVFRMNAAGALTTIHTFDGTDGTSPSELIEASDLSLYGATNQNGMNRGGTVFKLDAAATLTTLHAFLSANDGAFPLSPLVQTSDGTFYGTTETGGTWGLGTIFKLDALGNISTVNSVFSGLGGAYPRAGLIQGADGNFYGTITEVDELNSGSVFKLYPTTGLITALHIFGGSDAADNASPYAGLIQADDGRFYGTTISGGANGVGTVFVLDTAGTLTTLHSFAFASGARPRAGLIQASDGSFYGTTYEGGTSGLGTVFKLDTSRTFTTLHNFAGADGAYPRAELIQASDGSFYGTTSEGGASGVGTVFRLDMFGTLTTLHTFTGSGGAFPLAGLLQASDGNFYGTTSQGGGSGVGTVFRLETSGTLTTLHSFTTSDGAYPVARLIQASDGSFYGTTYQGGESGVGTIFRLTTAPVVALTDTPPNPTNNRSATISFSADRAATFACALDGGPFSPCSSPASVMNLADGRHTFEVRATASGNGGQASYSWVVDTVAPVVSLPADITKGAPNAGGVVVTFAAVATDTTAPANPTVYCTPSSGSVFQLGVTAVACSATDTAGNRASATFSVTINEEVSQIVAPGSSVTTDVEGDGATATDPIETTVTTPTGGTVSIQEIAAPASAPSGFSFIGYQANITALAATSANPLVLRFRLDASIVPTGQNQNTIEIRRNGALVPDCLGAGATPDPCVAARGLLPDGDVEFTIRTSAASAWTFSVTTAPLAIAGLMTRVDSLGLGRAETTGLKMTLDTAAKLLTRGAGRGAEAVLGAFIIEVRVLAHRGRLDRASCDFLTWYAQAVIRRIT